MKGRGVREGKAGRLGERQGNEGGREQEEEGEN